MDEAVLLKAWDCATAGKEIRKITATNSAMGKIGEREAAVSFIGHTITSTFAATQGGNNLECGGRAKRRHRFFLPRKGLQSPLAGSLCHPPRNVTISLPAISPEGCR